MTSGNTQHIRLAREGVRLNHKRLFRIYRKERLTVRRRGGRKRALGTRAPLASSRLRDKCLNEHLFPSLSAARRIIEAWRVDYSTMRPRTSLDGLTPIAFATRPAQGHNQSRLSR